MNQFPSGSTRLPGLPAELVWEIFDLASRDDNAMALVLARVAHGYNKKMTQNGYRVVTLYPESGLHQDTQRRADRFRLAINANASLASLVQVLLHHHSPVNDNLDIISACTKVRRLHLQVDDIFKDFHPPYEDGADLEINLLNRIIDPRSLKTPLFKMVTRIIFQQDVPYPPLVTGILELPRLTHVSLKFSQSELDGTSNIFEHAEVLLSNKALRIVHLYFWGAFQEDINPHVATIIQHLATISDARLMVELGQRWGGWRQWHQYYVEDRDFWREAETACAGWRTKVNVPGWITEQFVNIGML